MALTDSLISAKLQLLLFMIRLTLAGDPVRCRLFLTAAYLAGNSKKHHGTGPLAGKDI
jgi:hypothetical protein